MVLFGYFWVMFGVVVRIVKFLLLREELGVGLFLCVVGMFLGRFCVCLFKVFFNFVFGEGVFSLFWSLEFEFSVVEGF